jgi:hypothetical protein
MAIAMNKQLDVIDSDPSIWPPCSSMGTRIRRSSVMKSTGASQVLASGRRSIQHCVPKPELRNDKFLEPSPG